MVGLNITIQRVIPQSSSRLHGPMPGRLQAIEGGCSLRQNLPGAKMYRSLAALVILALSSFTARAQTATGTTEPPATAATAPHTPVAETAPHDGEDWTTISLAKSGLPLSAPGALSLGKVEMKGGCTRELLRMEWRRGDPIELYLIRPNTEKKLPVVLFLYNYTYDTDIFREERWCERVVENGFAVAGFSSALSWQRFHLPRPMKEWFVSELQEALATSTHDVQMILNYLATRGDLDMQNVGMFGQGSGGAVAILAAAADPRIRVLDLMDPWGDWPDWLKDSKQIPEEERPAYLKPEFLGRVSALDPVDYLPQLKDRSLRIQQVLADPVTPASARKKIAGSVPQASEVTSYPDTTAEAKGLGTNGIVGWLGGELHH